MDVFAGTVVFGIEALSRGADKVVFVESNKKNYMALKNSLLELNLKSQSMLLFKDGMAWIKESDLSVFDLIFLDPPFDNNYETKVLEMLCKNKNLKSSCKIYIEFSKFSDIKLSNSYEILKEKIVGDVKALLVKIKWQ